MSNPKCKHCDKEYKSENWLHEAGWCSEWCYFEQDPVVELLVKSAVQIYQDSSSIMSVTALSSLMIKASEESLIMGKAWKKFKNIITEDARKAGYELQLDYLEGNIDRHIGQLDGEGVYISGDPSKVH